jgi:hypothetical protein
MNNSFTVLCTPDRGKRKSSELRAVKPKHPAPSAEDPRTRRMKRLGYEEGDFYFTPEGHVVWTEVYHLKRGYCCQSGCRHCPYGNQPGQKRK